MVTKSTGIGKGKGKGTKKAIAQYNLSRKIKRLREELSTIAREDSDRLLAQSPQLLQAIFLLQAIAGSESEWSDRALDLSAQLTTLLVEQGYKEIADGAIVQGDAWIV